MIKKTLQDHIQLFSGVKKIRVHNLRHSHASLLVELGFSPVLIYEKLGHENVETTLSVPNSNTIPVAVHADINYIITP